MHTTAERTRNRHRTPAHDAAQGCLYTATTIDGTMVVSVRDPIDMGLLVEISRALRGRPEEVREILLDMAAIGPDSEVDIDVLIAIDAHYAKALSIFVVAEHKDNESLLEAQSRCPNIIWLD